jgi:hypothetical protein
MIPISFLGQNIANNLIEQYNRRLTFNFQLEMALKEQKVGQSVNEAEIGPERKFSNGSLELSQARGSWTTPSDFRYRRK